MTRFGPQAEALEAWLEARFDRSGGPGGQNVNKVATRVTLLLDFEACPLFQPEERERIREQLHTRLARDGRLRVVSSRHRDQARNRAAASERLVELLLQTLATRKTRRATRPSAGSRRRRIQAKKRRGETKRGRRPPSAD